MFLRILILSASIAAAALFALGYFVIGAVIGLAIGLVTALVWLLAYQRPSICPPPVALGVSMALAGGGLLAGADAWLMLFGATVSVACCDLVRLAHLLAQTTGASPQALTQFQSAHYARLALSLALSSAIMIAGRVVPLQVPLPGIVLLVLLILWAMNRAWRILTRIPD